VADFPFNIKLSAIDKISSPLQSIGRNIKALNDPIKRVQGSFKVFALKAKSQLNRLNSATNQFKQGLGNIRSALLPVGVALGAAGAGILAITKSTANFADDLAKTSARVGLTVEELQKYAFSAKLAGANQEDFNKGVVRFARVISDANSGLVTAKRGFERIGIDPSKIKNMNEGVLAVADAFSQMPDGIAKTTAAQELFGRAGTKLINLLNQGSDALKAQGVELEELGFLLDKEATTKAEDFNDTIFRLTTVFSGFKILLGTELIPIVTDIVKRMIEWTKQNKALIREKVVEFVEKLKEVILKLRDIVPILSQAFKFLKIAGVALSVLIAGKLIVGIVQLGSALVTIISVMKSLFFLLKTNGIWLVIASVAALAAIAFLVIKNWEKVKQTFIKLWDSPIGKLIQFITPIGWLISAAGLVVKNWEQVKSFFTDLWDGPIGSFLRTIGSGIASGFNFLTGNAFAGNNQQPSTPQASAIGSNIINRTTTNNARVGVDFTNIPPGTRINPIQNDGILDLSVGLAALPQ